MMDWLATSPGLRMALYDVEAFAVLAMAGMSKPARLRASVDLHEQRLIKERFFVVRRRNADRRFWPSG
jgi:hypothetical protein